MNTTRKIITTFLTAGVLSGAAIGTALADFPRQAYGDLSGNEPVSVRQLQISNQKALGAVHGRTVRTSNPAATADFPDQAYGDLSGDVPVPVRELTSARPGKNLLILPFIGDWNGTAKKGFPHQ